jgi:hypothetical protein
MTSQSALRSLVCFAILTTLLLLIGCGNTNVGTVSGTVTYKGQPVRSGDVNLISARGDAARVSIREDGSYNVPDPLPIGEYQVAITAPVSEPPAPGTKPKPVPPFDVPAKYRDTSTSKLTLQVKPGKNTYPIALD